MPLYRAVSKGGAAKPQPGRKGARSRDLKGNRCKTDEDCSVLSLTRLCILSLADNMKEVWVKDYAEKYLDHYVFRHIMGPFTLLPGDLVEELMRLLSTRQQLSRAALHLLLVPQLRSLSLEMCPGLVTSALCFHIAARCQGLWSLDLSGAQQLSSKVLSQTLHSLPALRSLSVAGMPCDRDTIRTVVQSCPLLRHLDVSRCHLLSPAALLGLGGGVFLSPTAGPSTSSSHFTSASQSSASSSCSDMSSSSFPPTLPPLPLCSLLALDIGFGEEEDDHVAAAAYLLLSLPRLERVAIEGLAQASSLIDRREFSRADRFTKREGIPSLEDVWRERRHEHTWRGKSETAGAGKEDVDEDEEERMFLDGYDSESEGNTSRDEQPSCSQNQSDESNSVVSQSGLTLRLRDVEGVACESLESLGRLCPGIISISVNFDNYEGNGERHAMHSFAAALRTWSGQLRSLTVHYPGHLDSLLPAMLVAGSSLTSLTLEGVRTNPYTPLLEVIRACPKLRVLFISAEPPFTTEQGRNLEELRGDVDLPHLPNLCSLTLKFSFEPSLRMPVLSWNSLKRVIKCLLAGSPLLEKLSLVSLPCNLNSVLRDLLPIASSFRFVGAQCLNPMPLRQLQHVNLSRTDVNMITAQRILRWCKKLTHLDMSHCWHVKEVEWRRIKDSSNVHIVWE